MSFVSEKLVNLRCELGVSSANNGTVTVPTKAPTRNRTPSSIKLLAFTSITGHHSMGALVPSPRPPFVPKGLRKPGIGPLSDGPNREQGCEPWDFGCPCMRLEIFA